MENKGSDVLVYPITVLIVDDHPLIRSAISQALSPQPEIKLVATAQNYAEAKEQVTHLLPDIIWLDMHIAPGDSIAEIRFLNKLSPSSRIIVLADREDEQEAFAAIMMGAQGYRSKQDVDAEEMMIMIQAICRGELVLRPVLLMGLVGRLRSAAMPLWGSESGLGYRALQPSASLNGLTQLTAREREILQLMSQGYRDRDIAKGLCISEKTVQKHVQSILSKLGAQNRTEAAYLIHQRVG
ncbi:MAG: response regulator transcription factor [Ktedonobacteraceae bacterium]|nr:response regulator transcription factor [Ktedonobacteraceae bacterium]MBV9021069.1 response regulator transcription factor [Ktedonobacteraceae bacterium]